MEGKVIGNRYLIVRQLGKGGRGSVYLCHDNKLQKDWAVKELDEAGDLERSMELELLKTISCNVFPRIVDIVKESGHVYLVMDYVEGITLKERMKKQVLTEKEVRVWALEIAKGIRYLHQMSVPILYMDCKPDNIMLTADGEIRLVDLGSAYVCFRDKKQRVSGTKYFAPREQKKHHEKMSQPDVRSDIYALGMTLYYLLTGGKKEHRKKGKLCIKDINPSVSWGMSHIIEKCTMENPDKRYQSMEDVIEQLVHIRKLSKWKRGTVFFHGLGMMLVKITLAILCIASAYLFQIKEESAFLVISVLSAFILFISCISKKVTWYEFNRDVFCGTGKRILYALILVAGINSILHMTTYAAKGEEVIQNKESEDNRTKLGVVLFDSVGRKILIKDGADWEIEEDIRFVIPINELEVGNGEIMISYVSKEKAISKQYSFLCCKE